MALIGVEGLVVVDTGDSLLVCRKDQSGRVGEVVEKLKTKTPPERGLVLSSIRHRGFR